MLLLRAAALVECASLVVLFGNLATAHLPAITSLGGPTHGLAYLVVVGATLRHPAADARTKASAFVPGIGGLLVLRRLPRRPSSSGGERPAQSSRSQGE